MCQTTRAWIEKSKDMGQKSTPNTKLYRYWMIEWMMAFSASERRTWNHQHGACPAVATLWGKGKTNPLQPEHKTCNTRLESRLEKKGGKDRARENWETIDGSLRHWSDYLDNAAKKVVAFESASGTRQRQNCSLSGLSRSPPPPGIGGWRLDAFVYVENRASWLLEARNYTKNFNRNCVSLSRALVWERYRFSQYRSLSIFTLFLSRSTEVRGIMLWGNARQHLVHRARSCLLCSTTRNVRNNGFHWRYLLSVCLSCRQRVQKSKTKLAKLIFLQSMHSVVCSVVERLLNSWEVLSFAYTITDYSVVRFPCSKD